MEDCILKIRQLEDQLSASESRVAQFLKQNASEILSMSIREVAEACGTSSPTIVRLCKHLGYKGYKEFCMALSADLASGGEARIQYQDVSPGDDLSTILQNVTSHNQAAIADTMRLLKLDTYARAVAALVKAPRVDFYGVGASGVVAQDAHQKFLRLGKPSQTSLDSHVQVVQAASLHKCDVAVLFSYSGETTDILDTLHEVQKTGATTISVSRYGSTRLSRAADIPLFVASTETIIRSAAMSSRIAMMHVVDLLFTGVATEAFDEY
ncbi:MAG: MurR/RpiR family transcriptional regulator, partial [Eubacteriales bacterium]|nr:MurR/RpiR family transcriptional regulator [Eubacteriales bacterium]